MSPANTAHAGSRTFERVTDPVCGMTIDPDAAVGSVIHEGTAYHFCSTHCLKKFEKDPELQRQMKANDRSAGRMEMQMVLAVRHLSGCQNTGPGNEAATNKNGVTTNYIAVE